MLAYTGQRVVPWREYPLASVLVVLNRRASLLACSLSLGVGGHQCFTGQGHCGFCTLIPSLAGRLLFCHLLDFSVPRRLFLYLIAVA